MRVRVADIAPSKTVTLVGDEPWLKQIAISVQEGSKTPSKITGEIQLRSDSAGFIYGKGRLKHEPILSCSRCDLEVPWPIEASIDVSWRPPFESHTPRELALSAEDLDVYFIENHTVDLEQLVIDTLLCSLPEQIPVRRNDSDDCGICGVSLKGSLVYGDDSDSPAKESPFAILKDLKS